ncbi:MAG: hypothetical protein ACYSWT_10910 [Planctomycetota bacterium]|jgi:hypothetical protein
MKIRLITLSVLGALVLLLVAAQSEDPVSKELVRLRQDLANLQLRVGRLEHAGGVPVTGVSATGSSHDDTMPVRAMVVGGINQVPAGDDNQDEIDDLQDDIDGLQQTVDVHRDRAEEAVGYRYRDGYGSYGRGSRAGELVSQHQISDRYATHLANKKEKLDRLQAAQNQHKQIIHGHEGTTIITLTTKSDLSSTLKNINIGDVVTWSGQRGSADENSETWRIDTLSKVDVD